MGLVRALTRISQTRFSSELGARGVEGRTERFWRVAHIQKRCCSTAMPHFSATICLNSASVVCFFTLNDSTCTAVTECHTKLRYTVWLPS